MSIIHDALRKAAAEGNRPLPGRSHAGRFQSRRPKIILYWVSAGFLLVLFLAWASGIHSKLLVLSKTDTSSFRKDLPSSPPVLSRRGDSKAIAAPAENVGRTDSKKGEGERLLEEGIASYRQGKTGAAHQAFMRALDLMPGSPIVHNNVGLTFKRQGKLESAKAHYEKAIELNPRYAEAHNNLGLVHDQLGSIDRASVYYKKALALQPDIPAFHLNYATLLERKGDFSEARREYERYLDLETSFSAMKSVALVKSHLKELQGQ